MAKISIEGIGTDLHLKKREEEAYETSYYLMYSIESIDIDGEPYDLDKVIHIEIDDVITHFGFKRGETSIKYVYDEDTDEGVPLVFEFIVPDADDYEIKMKHVEEDYDLGDFFLIDAIEVNGEEVLSEDAPDYYGTYSPDTDV